MKGKEFEQYLKEKNVNNDIIANFITKLQDYEKFLKRDELNLEKVNPEELVSYTEYLVSKDKDSVLDFLRAIMNYANFTKNYDFIISAIDISESFNAMDNLFTRIAEIHGEDMRDEIFKDLVIPVLGIDPEKKPKFTKTIMERMKTKLGEEETISLLSPCLHGRPPDDIEGDKVLLKELGIDGFLAKKHQDLIKRLENHRDNNTLEFAQYIDDEVIDFIKNDQTFSQGIREGNTIIVKKLPYQAKKYLNAVDDNMKRFYICYCPWVRGAMKDNTEEESLRNFCYCSAGWYKLYWDQILEHPIKAEPINTALDGALECKIALHIPEEVLKPFIK